MDKLDLQIVISAEDEASSKLDDIAKKAQSLGKGMAVVGGILATALGFAVKSASDAQVQMAKLDATLGTMGKAGLQARDAILKAGDATLKLGFDNEEASVSITKFFQRTGDLTTSIKLNALAMDLARAKSIDLSTASTLVGQVLAGNGKVLKAYGIDIKDTASPLEALAELQTKVGGQAQAFSQTFAGASEVMKQQISELSEKVGAQLLPVLSNLVTRITPVIEKITAWATAHPQLAQNIVLVVAGITALMLVLAPLLIALPSLIAFFSLLSPPVLIVIGILAGLALSVYNVVKIFQLLRDDGTLIWEGIKLTIKEAIDSIVGYFKPLFDAIERVKSALSSVGSAVSGKVSSVVSSVKGFVSGKKASGGTVQGGKTFMVGEQGPELFTPSSNGFISANSRLAGMGGGGITINMNGGTYLSERVAEDIGDMIIQKFKKISKIGIN